MYRSALQQNIRGGRVVVLCTEGDHETAHKAEYSLQIPWAGETLIPVLFNVVLQLVVYNFAILKGRNIDQSRSLAKSVTVE